jgi:hypothetical protein
MITDINYEKLIGINEIKKVDYLDETS